MDTTELEARLDALLAQRKRIVLALDGMAASGKTTLAAALAVRYSHSAVVHMDDFTIPLDARTPGYFEAQLSNADVGRLDREVLAPLARGECACYRPYRCHPEAGFLAPVCIEPNVRLLIVEGAYCLHPLLFERYDLRVLCVISPELQRERILRRNGRAQLVRFSAQWIPMENRHIEVRRLAQTCDLCLSADQDG